MGKFIEEIVCEIPRWQREYVFKSDVRPLYYKKGMNLPDSYKKRIKSGLYSWKLNNGAETLWNTKAKKFILKNSKTAGKAKTWNFNGQGFCSLHWRVKDELTAYYKRYFSGYIIQQLTEIKDMEHREVIISCDIYETDHPNLPDADNMWLLEKFFIDTLHENDIIPNDNMPYVRGAGAKTYHIVNKEEDRKLTFKIRVYER